MSKVLTRDHGELLPSANVHQQTWKGLPENKMLENHHFHLHMHGTLSDEKLSQEVKARRKERGSCMLVFYSYSLHTQLVVCCLLWEFADIHLYIMCNCCGDPCPYRFSNCLLNSYNEIISDSWV